MKTTNKKKKNNTLINIVDFRSLSCFFFRLNIRHKALRNALVSFQGILLMVCHGNQKNSVIQLGK